MKPFSIGSKQIGNCHPVYIIAEISANHNHNIQEAIDLIHIAAECGADAVKIQTYTPDTMTIDSDKEYFQIGKGTVWEGKSLYQLYGEAYTPWDWTPRLIEESKKVGITLFSSPFDSTAVDFLEELDMPAHKIASFELVDHHLIASVAKTGKPVIMSTGMASLSEIAAAVEVLETNGCSDYALLKCTSGYPADPREMNLRTIPHLAEIFGHPAGLSDHTLGTAVPVAAVAMGACIVEKHFIKARSNGGPDAGFSLEPDELRQLVESIRMTEQALGEVRFEVSEREAASRIFRRSLFFVADLEQGDELTEANVRCIRPGYGIAPKHLPNILGRKAKAPISRGTPVSWDLLA